MFENKYICTKSYYKEYYKYSYFKKPIMIILNTILIISFVINVLNVIFPRLSNADSYTPKLYIANVLVILCIEMYIYIKNINLAYNRDLEINNGNDIEIKLVITEDDINISNNLKKNTNIEFKNIQKVIKTKNYYILVSKANLTVALKKDSFIKGTADEFEKFLKQKKLV